VTPATVRAEIETIAARELTLDGALTEADLGEGLDSIQRLQLVVAIEDHFEVALDPNEDQLLVTLDDLVAAVIKARGALPADDTQ
jgi:acyl carrier protein